MNSTTKFPTALFNMPMLDLSGAAIATLVTKAGGVHSQFTTSTPHGIAAGGTTITISGSGSYDGMWTAYQITDDYTFYINTPFIDEAAAGTVYLMGMSSPSIFRPIGTKVYIDSAADYSGTVAGTVKFTTSSNHGFITGEKIIIEGTTDYNGTYDVTRVDGDEFYVTATWVDSQTGTAKDYPQTDPFGSDVVYKMMIASGHNTPYARLTFMEAQDIYPNWIMAFKTLNKDKLANFVRLSVDGGLSNYYQFGGIVSDVGIVENEWRYCSLQNWLKTSNGTVDDWATGSEDQALSVKALILYNNDSPASDDSVLYFGGIRTKDIEKAKVILTFDDSADGPIDYALAKMSVAGFKGVVAPTPNVVTTEAKRADVQACYDAGWDVVNHSYTHSDFTGTAPAYQLIDDYAKWKQWAATYGWLRGSNMATYANYTIKLDTLDGADVIEPYIQMARGDGYRAMYGDTLPNSNTRTLCTYIPPDYLNIGAVASTSGSASDYDSSTVKTKLADADNGRGVLVVMLHGIVESSPVNDEVTQGWFDGLMADLKTRVAAGTVEVVTMTEWFNEINGLEQTKLIIAGD